MQPTNLQSEYILKMKQQTHDKLNVWRTRKKSEPQMGFEPTTLRETHKLIRVLQTFNLLCVCCFIFKENSGKKITWLWWFYHFVKAPVFKIFFVPHINAKLAFSNSSSLKSVFEKLCFGDRLVRTVDLSIEIKLCSQNSVSCHLKMDHIHVCISLVPDKTRFWAWDLYKVQTHTFVFHGDGFPHSLQHQKPLCPSSG